MQLIVHSALYYHFNHSIVSDNIYDGWTQELVQLHKDFPDYSDRYDEYFVDWAGETGYHFPKDEHILSIADGLLRTHDRKRNVEELAKRKPVDEFFEF